MKNDFLRKLLSLTLSAIMMSSFAAVGTYAATEETVKWGYVEDFENYEVGEKPETTYVEYSEVIVGDETNKYLGNKTTITVNKFPKEKVVVSMDITITGFSWVRLMHGTKIDDSDTQYMGDWITKDEAGTHTIIFEYTPTEAEASQTYFTIANDGGITAIDNVKIYIDGENLQPAPAFELDLDDYAQGETVYTNNVVTLQNGTVLNNGTYNYLPGHEIKINRYPEKKLIIDLELEGEGWTQLYAAGESSNIPLQNTGHGSSGYVKYRFVVKPDSANSYSFLKLALPPERHIRSLKIWNDDEESGKFSWDYSETFENYEVGEKLETTYVEYSEAITGDEANKYLPKKTTVTINKFPQKKLIVTMDVVAKNYSWVGMWKVGTSGEVLMGSTYGISDATDTKHHVVFEYTPTEEDVDYTSFKIMNDGEIASIDNLKIYLDGENLKPAPAFELDLDDYTQGETVYTNDVVTLQNRTVLNNGTYNYLPGHEIKINRYPEKKLIIDLEMEGEGWTQLYAVGESSESVLQNTGHGSSGYVKYHFVVKPDSSNSYSFLKLVLPDTRHIRSLKIWHDDEETVIETWENYSEYSYMTDFETDAVDTTPTDKYISFGNKTVVANNGNNEIDGSAISLTKIPEKNFIVSCDIRLMSSTSAEQLQLWINGESGDNTIVAHHYDSYISDENKHSLMIIGDMNRQTINVYIDGILTNNVQKNESDWKAKVDSKSITSIGVQLYDLFIDNIKIDIDKEMLYTGCMISDSNGARLNTLISGTTVRGAVYGVSNLRKDNPAQMIIALYEIKEDGTPYLVNSDITDLNAKFGGIVYYGDEFSVGTLDADKMYCVKQFVWDNVDDMNPLTLVSEIYTATNN